MTSIIGLPKKTVLIAMHLVSFLILGAGAAVGSMLDPILAFSCLIVLVAFGVLNFFSLLSVFTNVRFYTAEARGYLLVYKEDSCAYCVVNPLGQAILMLLFVIGATVMTDWESLGVPPVNTLTGIYGFYAIWQFLMILLVSSK